MKSPKRQTRQKRNGVLQPRELLFLEFLSRAQPVHTGHCRDLLGISPAIAYRLLRKLLDMGYVDVHTPAMCDKNRYCLNAKARPVLARVFDRDPEDFRVQRGIGKVNLAHHEATVDLFVWLTVAAARTSWVDGVAFLFERDIRATLGVGTNLRGVLVPDATACLTLTGGRKVGLAFEVDRATEALSYILRTKVTGYLDLWDQAAPLMGCTEWAVCWTTPSQRRVHKLAAASWEAGVPEGRFFFAPHASLTAQTILQEVWQTPRQVGADAARLLTERPLPGGHTHWQNGFASRGQGSGRKQADSSDDASHPFSSGDVG